MEFNRHPLLVNRRERRNSSTFSSTLLDAIYRSIDETDGGGVAGEEDMVVYRETKKQSCTGFEYHDEDMARHRRACLIEKLMEKKVTQTEKVVIRRRSAPEFDRNPWGRLTLTHSSSSSSDSSSGGGFSSSEAESIYGGAPTKPKPVRTTTATSFWSKTGEVKKQRKSNKTHDHNQDKKSKTTAAMKIYNDLKKAKNQPLSPGGRLASFLNSLFTTNKSKSDEITTAATATESKSGHASTCSSASSFSRSCLSSGNSKTGKRSVRFNFDDDYQPYSRQKQKSSYNNKNRDPLINSIKNEVKIQILEKKYNQKMTHEEEQVHEMDIEDDDDAASCASSDLFELDNLSAIGIDRYCKELPVYETTHVHTNRAIANGLIS